MVHRRITVCHYNPLQSRPLADDRIRWRTESQQKLHLWVRQQAQVFNAAQQFHEWELSFTPTAIGHFAKIPIAVDARLATALIELHKQRVVTGLALLIEKIPLWVGNALCRVGRREIACENDASIRSAFSNKSDYEAFQNGSDFQNGFADVHDTEFHGVCRAVDEFVSAVISRNAVPIGCVLNLGAFPLGREPVRSVPLFEGKWISEQALELIVFSRMIRRDGAICLPPVDPHPGAFERAFRKDTAWLADTTTDSARTIEELPSEIGYEELAQYWDKAGAHVRDLNLPHRLIKDQTYLNAEEVKSADDELLREVRLQDYSEFNTGVLVEDWNQWVREKQPIVQAGGVQVSIGELNDAGMFPDRYDLLAVDDRGRLQEMVSARRHTIQQLILDCRNHRIESLFSEAGILAPTEHEKEIVRILFRRSMTAEQLIDELECPRRTFFNKGWLARLARCDVVRSNRLIGGYYLKAFPPR